MFTLPIIDRHNFVQDLFFSRRGSFLKENYITVSEDEIENYMPDISKNTKRGTRGSRGPQSKLKKKIADYSDNLHFINKCHRMGLYTFQDVMDKGSAGLRQQPEFDMLWYAEILGVMNTLDLLDIYEQMSLQFHLPYNIRQKT